MDVSWLLLVVAAAVFVSSVLLVVGCLRCRHKGPLVSIRQVNASDEYIPRIYPYQPNSDQLPRPYTPLISFPRSAGPGTQRSHRSSESNPSYENPPDGPAYVNTESDQEDPGYIVVLPEVDPQPTNQSRASTPSSDVHYENVDVPQRGSRRDGSASSPPSENYLNVDPPPSLRPASDLSTQGDTDDDDTEDDHDEEDEEDDDDDDDDDNDDDDDDDDVGNYVNVQTGT